jgi:hypothetical protein
MKDRAKLAAVALAFSALFGFLIFQAGVASNHPKAQHQQAAASQDHEQKNIFERFWEWTTDDPVAVYTLVLAISTIGLWIVTWRGIRGQSRETRILQRAYLSVEPAGIHPITRATKKAVAHIQISNVGKLPAKDVKWLINHEPSEDHDRRDFPVREELAEGEITLSPGISMQQGGGIVNVDTELQLPLGWYLYVWGAAYYTDGFGEKRVTRFCHRYNCSNVTETVHPGGWPSGYKIESSLARYNRWGNDAT